MHSCSSTYGTNYIAIISSVLTCSCSLHAHDTFFQANFLQFKLFHAQLLTLYLFPYNGKAYSMFVKANVDIHRPTVLLIPTVHNHLVEVIFYLTNSIQTGQCGPTKMYQYIYISSNKLTSF